MSIKGIDAQIMISRLPDTAKDTSALQKRPEVWQDHLGVQGRANDAHQQEKVAKTSESEMEAIRTDVEGGSGGGYGSEGGKHHGKGDNEDELLPGTLVPPERHIIDIKV